MKCEDIRETASDVDFKMEEALQAFSFFVVLPVALTLYCPRLQAVRIQQMAYKSMERTRQGLEEQTGILTTLRSTVVDISDKMTEVFSRH